SPRCQDDRGTGDERRAGPHGRNRRVRRRAQSARKDRGGRAHLCLLRSPRGGRPAARGGGLAGDGAQVHQSANRQIRGSIRIPPPDRHLRHALAPYAHLPLPAMADTAFVARVPDLELEGYEIIVPADARDDAWHRAEDAGATRTGLLAFEIARIEAGRPEWGLDMDETTIPQEANFDELHAISYTKGCYVGQEVVARVHFRGHVNRHLRGLLVGQSEPPAHGTALLDASGTQVGDVRSGGLSPRLGGIALAMVRREIAPGTTLRALGQENESSVDVAELPFPL